MSTKIEALAAIIKSRRTVKPFMMNGAKIPDDEVQQLLELADWAPTHGLTEPWRFIVYANPTDFCNAHAELYRQNAPADEFNQGIYDGLANQGNKASHVIIAVMRRGNLPKIPSFEEVAATACAMQNILLGATAFRIASYWGTGGMILKPAMKSFLNLRNEDEVMGVLYLGYADEYPAGVRKVPLEEKVKWL